MPKYIIAGSDYHPFTYDELAKPVSDSAQIHRATQEALDTLSMQAGDIAAQIGDNAPEAKALYEKYQNLLKQATENLYYKGYSSASAIDLSRARKSYGDDMTKIQHAIENKAKAVSWKNSLMGNDDTTIMEYNPSLDSIDKWIDDPSYGYGHTYSGKRLVDMSKDFFGNFQRELRDPNSQWHSLYGQYFERSLKYGSFADEVSQAIKLTAEGKRSDNPWIAALQDNMDAIYNSSGMSKWANEDQKKQAYTYIAQGLAASIGLTQPERINNRAFLDDNQRAQRDYYRSKSGPVENQQQQSPYFDFKGKSVVRGDPEFTKKMDSLNRLVPAFQNIISHVPDGDYDGYVQRVMESRKLRNDKDAYGAAQDIQYIKDVLAEKGVEFNADNIKAEYAKAYEAQNQLLMATQNYGYRGRESGQQQVIRDYIGTYGINKDNVQSLASFTSPEVNRPVTMEDIKALQDDPDTSFTFDAINNQIVLYSSYKDSIALSTRGLRNIHGTVPAELVNSMFLKNGETSSAPYDSLDPATQRKIDEIVHMNKNGRGQFGNTTMDCEQIANIAHMAQMDILKNGDNGTKQVAVNTLINWLFAAIDQNSSTKHTAQGQTGDELKSTGYTLGSPVTEPANPSV